MAKALKIAAIGLGVTALAFTGVGLAVGMGTLATSFGFGVSASTLFLASAGASAAASLLQKAPKVPSSQTDRLTASIDPRAFRKTILGQTAWPADVRFEEWSGKDQEYCDWVVAHASHACDGLEEIWFNTEMAWSATTGVTAKYRGYFNVIHTVLEGSPSNAFTINSGRWNQSARLTGCAYSHWRFKVTGNSKKAESPFSSGLPSRITVIGRGAKLYDPRRDSTVPGGNGPMRADDQSTWRYTADDGVVIGENLALHILRVVLGWRIRNPSTGVMKLATGSGVPARRLDLGSFIVAANLCDELVNRSAGGQEPRYHGASVVSEGDDAKTVLDMQCAACCGRFRDTGGKLALVIAHNDLALAAVDDGLNDDDVIGAFTWNPDAALETIPNVVRGKYVDATANSLYQMIDYPEVRLASLDGQDRIFPLDLGAVESPSHAQRVAKQVLQRKQYPREFSAPFDIRAWKYAVGDPVPFTFAPLSFTRALFRVKEQELGQNGICNMTLTYESASFYQWDASDALPVQAAEAIVYNASNSALIQAIGEAGTTANWSAVADDDGMKPEPGATVGAPEGTNVGGRPALTVIQQIDKAKADIDGLIAAASESQTDLSEQVDAAKAAQTAAQTARDQSQAARDAASAASTLSGAARDAAKTAQTSAEAAASTAAQRATDAGGYAQTASGQATIATQKADAASQSASSASASATTASTKAGEASTSSQSAVTAKNDAAGSATSAGTSAGVATQAKTDAQAAANAASTSASTASSRADAAGQSATAAAGSATAASTKAGEASTSAGQASTSASNAQGSSNSAASSSSLSATARDAAQAAARQTFPATFEDDKTYWSYGAALVRTFSSEANAYVVSNAAANTYADLTRLGTVPHVPGKKWRIRVRAKAGANGYNLLVRILGLTNQSLGGATATGDYFRDAILTLNTAFGWYEAIIDPPTDPSVKFLTVCTYPGYPALASIVSVASLEMTDATADQAAASSASAANTSASSAAASKTGADTSASAAAQAKLDAQTALGGANAARDTAVTSASNAAGSANTAATQATLSARAASDAAGAAQNNNRSPGAARSMWSYNQYNNFTPDPGMTLPAVAGGAFSYNSVTGDAVTLAALHLHPTKPSKVDPTRRIRVTARIKQVAGGSNGDTGDNTLYLTLWDKDGNLLNGNTQYMGAVTTSVSGPEMTIQVVIRPSDYNANTAYIRPMYRSPGEGRYIQVNQLYWEDVESAQQSADSASASNASASSASASRDAAGSSAAAANQSRIDAQSANGAAQGAASAANGAAVAADASRSQAQTYATMTATYTNGIVNPNPNFVVYPNPNLPDGWYAWSDGYVPRYQRDSAYRPTGGYRCNIDCRADNVACGIQRSDDLPIYPGWYVMEAEVDCQIGSYMDSGVTIQGYNSIHFGSEPDINGIISASPGVGPRTFSKLTYVDRNLTNWHAMANWQGFRGSLTPKFIVWYRCALRRALQPEIDAGKALSGATANAARIEAVNQTLSDQYGALAQRVSNTEATAGSLSARTGITESSVADLRTKAAAARIELAASSSGGRVAMTLRSDTVNGTGIDLVGDVAFTREQGGAVTVVNGLGMKTYDANGALVFQAGIY